MKFKDRPPIAELLRHPQHISKLAFYTIPLIIVASLFAYRSNLKLLSILLFCLFITSVIHWHKHQNAHYWSVYIHLFFNHICLLGMGVYCIYPL